MLFKTVVCTGSPTALNPNESKRLKSAKKSVLYFNRISIKGTAFSLSRSKCSLDCFRYRIKKKIAATIKSRLNSSKVLHPCY